LVYALEEKRKVTYHLQSTPTTVKNRIRACLIYWGGVIITLQRHSDQTYEGNTSTLWSTRKEPKLDSTIPKILSVMHHRVPSGLAARLAEYIQTIKQMDLSSGVDFDFVTISNRKTWVMGGAKVHHTLSNCRIGLFINRARSRTARNVE
jgi:hypothetical protein